MGHAGSRTAGNWRSAPNQSVRFVARTCEVVISVSPGSSLRFHALPLAGAAQLGGCYEGWVLKLGTWGSSGCESRCRSERQAIKLTRSRSKTTVVSIEIGWASFRHPSTSSSLPGEAARGRGDGCRSGQKDTMGRMLF